MTSPELENLVKIGQLKREPPAAGEVEGLQRSGETRLSDAANPDLSLESRFDLAYNAAHALALAALRRHGYRAGNRFLVFQTLAHTLGLPPAACWPSAMRPGIWRSTRVRSPSTNVWWRTSSTRQRRCRRPCGPAGRPGSRECAPPYGHDRARAGAAHPHTLTGARIPQRQAELRQAELPHRARQAAGPRDDGGSEGRP